MMMLPFIVLAAAVMVFGVVVSAGVAFATYDYDDALSELKNSRLRYQKVLDTARSSAMVLGGILGFWFLGTHAQTLVGLLQRAAVARGTARPMVTSSSTILAAPVTPTFRIGVPNF